MPGRDNPFLDISNMSVGEGLRMEERLSSKLEKIQKQVDTMLVVITNQKEQIVLLQEVIKSKGL